MDAVPESRALEVTRRGTVSYFRIAKDPLGQTTRRGRFLGFLDDGGPRVPLQRDLFTFWAGVAGNSTTSPRTSSAILFPFALGSTWRVRAVSAPVRHQRPAANGNVTYASSAVCWHLGLLFDLGVTQRGSTGGPDHPRCVIYFVAFDGASSAYSR